MTAVASGRERPRRMLVTWVTFVGQPVRIACDTRCDKAWGINGRARAGQEYLIDDALATAPQDPGSYEGDDAKPVTLDEAHNKWCARECERSVLVVPGDEIKLPEFRVRLVTP